MREFLDPILSADPLLLVIYVVVYVLWGIGMNTFGKKAKIAEFKYWWQIITVYVLYMIPISILMKEMLWYEQYVYGLFFMGILEFGGYMIKSSIAHPNNIMDKFFGERNFALGMTLFFASYFPLGNLAVGWVFDCLQ